MASKKLGNLIKEARTGAGLTQVSTKTGNVASGSVIIKNTLGNAMPETGGMGTTALYIGGAALVLSALAARGETRVEGAHLVDRGYDHLEQMLHALGADIVRGAEG